MKRLRHAKHRRDFVNWGIFGSWLFDDDDDAATSAKIYFL
jgi:hypothetical protein